MCLFAFATAAPITNDETILGQVGNPNIGENPTDQEGIRRALWWALLLAVG